MQKTHVPFRAVLFISVLLILTIFARLGTGQGPPPAPKVFTSTELGFSFSPPQDARDLTKYQQQAQEQRLAVNHSTNVLTILLALVPGPDDTASDWYSVGVQSYPRQNLSSLSDRDACIQFSRRVARSAHESGAPMEAKIGGANFVVSSFTLQENALTKQARVYATIRKDRIVGISFAANSADVLNRIVETIKTFTPQ